MMNYSIAKLGNSFNMLANMSSVRAGFLPPAKDSSSSISFISAIMWFWLWFFFKIMGILLYYGPNFMVNVLSTNYQITLSLSSILVTMSVITTVCFFVVRYKYLTRYSINTKALNEHKKVNKSLDLVGSMKKSKRGDSKSTNYLDEFLSAIKVFGYLERPVFHELTKSMTTQKLAADEMIHLDEKIGFLIVVEGTMQIYIKVNNNEAGSDVGNAENELNFEKDDILMLGSQRYQLLNEVKSGAPLSALMSTLDMFRPGENESHLDTYQLSPRSPLHKFSPNVTGSSNLDPLLPLFTNQPEEDALPEIIARPKIKKESDHYNSATLAIIPRAAFQKVNVKYPKATSHIVTMVLTRLYKVTMNTMHNYMGLTREIIESEAQLNKLLLEDNSLPSYLYDGILEKFYGSNGTLDNNQGGSSLSLNRRTESSSISVGKKLNSKPLERTKSSRYVALDSRSKSTHPGDLLSSVPLSRRSDHYQNNTVMHIDLVDSKLQNKSKISVMENSKNPSSYNSTYYIPAKSSDDFENIRARTFSHDREETEETSLRIAIIENMFKSLGINEIANLGLDFSSSDSASSSVSSSTVGLATLAKNGEQLNLNHDIFGLLHEERNLSSSSIPNNLQRSRTNYKVFNTVNQSKLKHLNPIASEERSSIDTNMMNSTLKHKLHSLQAVENKLHNAKCEFSKFLEIKYVAPDSTLIHLSSFNSGLYYVIDGSLDVLYKSSSKDTDTSQRGEFKRLYSVKQGGVAGYLNSVVGYRSLVTVKTPKNAGAIVAHLSKFDFSKLMDKYYFLQLAVASKLKSLLSKQILTIDYALEWSHIPAGNVLCSQGDLANGFHIVLSGRFRVIRYNEFRKSEVHLEDESMDTHSYSSNLIDETNNDMHHRKREDYTVLGEYGHGESIGEVEVLTASRRTNSLVAVRDSETARIPRTLFEMLSIQNPSLMVKISRIVANKVTSKQEIYPGLDDRAGNIGLIPTSTEPHVSTEYKTITILPTVAGLPVRDFADRLVHALKAIGRNVIELDQASTLTHLGRYAFDERLAQLKLSGYFAYLEEEYETIVYVCDTPLKSNWTTTCISQGDCILLLADAEDDSVANNIGDYERLLVQSKTTARTDLCLIHPDRYVVPGSTSVWLKNRIWVQGHHHIQMEIGRNENEESTKRSNFIRDIAAKISSKTNPNIKSKLENVKTKAISSLNKFNDRFKQNNDSSYKSVQAHKNDFLRLARILSNEGVGLVLGGGGSRGISHVGVLVSLERHGIPIDFIGGTSIGSFVGGLYAKEFNIVSVYARTKRFAKRVSSLWRMVLDLTYPVTSYITGYEFNRGIWKVFGSSEIEDFWVRYFCNSTNITNSTMDIHESGFLWRFIRASMSLAGLLPPITYNGCMLLDGGYLDNLPVMEMKKKGAKYIIAVDVGSVDDRTPMNYGDTLSGFWVLLNRWNPFSKHPNVPNMMDIQLRLAYVASVNALEIAKNTPGVIYLRPPIDNYATLDFAKFDEIYQVGAAYADNLLTKWEQMGKLPSIVGMLDKKKIRSEQESRTYYRRNSI